MKKQRVKQALTEEIDRLAPQTMWEETDGSVNLYGDYRLVQNRGECTVHTALRDPINFNSRRAAAIWCIADRCGDRQLSIDIRSIDNQLARMTADFDARRMLTGNLEFNQLIQAKLEPRRHKIQSLRNELDRCVKLAKYYQRGLTK